MLTRLVKRGIRSRSFGTNAHYTYGQAERDVLQKLAGRSLLRIDDYSPKQLQSVLSLAHHLKRLHKTKLLPRALVGESVATIFEKRSTRTRVSTETGMGLLGGRSIFLSSDDIQLGVNETIKDTALVLSRYNSILLARVYAHSTVKVLEEFSDVPVINALCDLHHPLQILADFMTIQEKFGSSLKGLNISWVGDGNNVLHDLMLGAPLLGVNCTVATPKGYEPNIKVVSEALRLADKCDTTLRLFNDPLEAVEDCNVVFTDTWVSMGQEADAKARLEAFKGYQVTFDMMKKGEAKEDWKFMHCLPRHKEEVDDEVFYSDRSLVFDEAENRMYTVMAVMCTMLGHTDFV